MVQPSSMDPSVVNIPSDSITTNTNDPNCKMYKGVRKRKWGKWVSEIRLPNSRERIWLGSYKTQEKAARAFDAALYCLRGRCASFNFPDTPLKLEINNKNVALHNNSLSHQEIQEVAAKFADDFSQKGRENKKNNQEEEEEEEEEEEPSNNDVNNDNNSNKDFANKCPASSLLLSPEHDYGEAMEVDHGDMRAMDWTFLNVLDDHDDIYNSNNNIGVNDYFGLDKMQYYSGELMYSTPPTFFEDDNGEEIDQDGDAFSNHSFLWSWNF